MRAGLLTGGHPFEAAPFFAMCDALEGIEWRRLGHPDAYLSLLREGWDDLDVLVFYDMPGVEFTRSEPPLVTPHPPAEVVELFARLTAVGMPMVFLHHAIASWPAWPEFGDMLGGRFHYASGVFGGEEWPASGYRLDVVHEIDVVAVDHPVCAGLGAGFVLTDELYLFPVKESTVTPLLRSRARFRDDEFFSADLAIRGERGSRRGWSHPPGSDLMAWTTTARASTIVYLQPGDGPATFADPNYRRLLANAVRWVADLSRG